MMLLNKQMAEFVNVLQVNKPAKTVSSSAWYLALLCFFPFSQHFHNTDFNVFRVSFVSRWCNKVTFFFFFINYHFSSLSSRIWAAENIRYYYYILNNMNKRNESLQTQNNIFVGCSPVMKVAKSASVHTNSLSHPTNMSCLRTQSHSCCQKSGL